MKISTFLFLIFSFVFPSTVFAQLNLETIENLPTAASTKKSKSMKLRSIYITNKM